MRKKFEPPSRALIDLRDERDDLSIRLNLLEENRLTAPLSFLALNRTLRFWNDASLPKRGYRPPKSAVPG
jgi:hypothetical protein